MNQPNRRRRSMTEQAADAAVDQACRSLRLPTIRTRFTEIADGAEREQLTYRGFLAELLLAECADRDRRRSARRVKSAGFPREKWLSDFDYDANPNINPATIHTLARCEWVRKGEPLCLIGDSETGKTHLLIGYRRRPSRVPGSIHAGHQTSQRTGRSGRRTPAGEDHRPLRSRRFTLH
jgi:DNA replication protein DnaC